MVTVADVCGGDSQDGYAKKVREPQRQVTMITKTWGGHDAEIELDVVGIVGLSWLW